MRARMFWQAVTTTGTVCHYFGNRRITLCYLVRMKGIFNILWLQKKVLVN